MLNLGDKLLQAQVVTQEDLERVAIQKKKAARRKRRDDRKELFKRLGAALHVPSEILEQNMAEFSVKELRQAIQAAPGILAGLELRSMVLEELQAVWRESFQKNDIPEK